MYIQRPRDQIPSTVNPSHAHNRSPLTNPTPTVTALPARATLSTLHAPPTTLLTPTVNTPPPPSWSSSRPQTVFHTVMHIHSLVAPSLFILSFVHTFNHPLSCPLIFPLTYHSHTRSHRPVPSSNPPFCPFPDMGALYSTALHSHCPSFSLSPRPLPLALSPFRPHISPPAVRRTLGNGN